MSARRSSTSDRPRSSASQELTEFFGGGGDDLLERFFGGGGRAAGPGPGPAASRASRRPRRAGTGFVISKDGYILTNNHVVEGATKIEVRLYGDDADVYHEAKVDRPRSAHRQRADPADREADEASCTEVKFGDSAQMEPGDWVMAIGNPFGLAHTVSVGVISAKERPFPITDGRSQDVLQTDAAINPGNSGGPLLNVRGEVVGINTAIYTDARQQGNIGIGFAIPINMVRELLPQLRSGKITRGVIGVQVLPVARRRARRVRAQGAPRRAGRRRHPGRPGGEGGPRARRHHPRVQRQARARPRSTWCRQWSRTKPGTTVPVKVLRDKQERTLNITVDELNLDDETTRAERGGRRDDEPDEQASAGFGLTLGAAHVRHRCGGCGCRPDTEGVLVTGVEQGSPAFRAGLSRGDVILQVNRQAVAVAEEASRAARTRWPTAAPPSC